MTNQEMFDKAWNGLKGQNWEQSLNPKYGGDEFVESRCAYYGIGGKRCAWGHVDPTLTNQTTSVRGLRSTLTGVAATLDDHQLLFAMALQRAHDTQSLNSSMQQRFIELAEKYGLTIPE